VAPFRPAVVELRIDRRLLELRVEYSATDERSDVVRQLVNFYAQI
jgi:hypothetical protein